VVAGYAILSDLYTFTGITNVMPHVKHVVYNMRVLYNRTEDVSTKMTYYNKKSIS
ncbi:hypothetical protein MTO96_035392, partial [Rhipicephalus appendiculatus]